MIGGGLVKTLFCAKSDYSLSYSLPTPYRQYIIHPDRNMERINNICDKEVTFKFRFIIANCKNF